jgi:putative ABC transport system permease protein
MSSLDKKLMRDIVRLWAQALAIALVMASGVTTLVLAVGAYRSLEETRAAYYERYRFADVFATAKRVPQFVEQQILEIPGVAAVETRIAEYALLDIEGMKQPATGLAISLPDHRELRLNRIYLRKGRLPEPGRVDEVIVNEAFADAHSFSVGAQFHAILNGYKRPLRIVGIALSPEFIYALGPGDLIPDDRRFCDMWMSEKALAAMFDLEGAFNSLSVKLLRNANEAEVIDQLDNILERYGGTGSYGRKDQTSHAFLDAELKQLSSMARIIPPIFLLVSAFLINITLTRLIALEREQIGLLKALGYRRMAIALHYMKLVAAIAVLGIAIGSIAGTWLGHGLTRLYADFFHFPFLIFHRGMDIYVLAAGVSIATALAGGVRGIYTALTLPPAVAMSPPVPTHYAHLGIDRFPLLRHLSQLTIMAIRHIIRWPVRSGMTVLGIAMSGALLITALFSMDSIEFMIDTVYFQADRQDASINFTEERPMKVIQEVENLPGVLAVEPYRTVAVRLRNGHYERKLAITGKLPGSDLSRVLNSNNKPVELPEAGLLISERVAKLLHANRGDLVDVEILDSSRGQGSLDAATIGKRRSMRRVPVAGTIQSYLGLAVFMDLHALNDMLDEAPVVSGAHMAIDESRTDSLFREIKDIPAISAIALQKEALGKFRETLATNINIMTTVYVVLSVIISFGVVYNSARIQLSERAREFASLRVLGFTKAEVSHVLLLELALLVAAAIPLAWVIGYGFAWATVQGFESDLYTVPFVIKPNTYAVSALVVLGSATASALIVRSRVDRLNMIKALKTRE